MKKMFIELYFHGEFCLLFTEIVRQLMNTQGSSRQGNPGEYEYMGLGMRV